MSSNATFDLAMTEDGIPFCEKCGVEAENVDVCEECGTVFTPHPDDLPETPRIGKVYGITAKQVAPTRAIHRP